MVCNFKGKIAYNHPIKKHNSWHVGGSVKCCYWPHDLEDMKKFIASLPSSENIIFLGLGSNVLFPDGLLDATVIITVKGLNTLGKSLDEDGLLSVGAGVSCAKIAKATVKLGLIGGAFFSGIPGTLGGALRMNAGAFGSETWQFVDSVSFLHRNGDIENMAAADFNVGYRHVDILYAGWFVAAKLNFKHEALNDSVEAISELLKKRNSAQPIGSFSCGSVFKNPPGNHAAALIESCGLKGKSTGGAMVSPKHANFILNFNDASSQDVNSLIEYVRDSVADKFSILLEPEVKIFHNEV